MTEGNINNKNGFEIRAGLLQMAQRIVELNAQVMLQQTKEWSEVTAEQITEVAEKLNVFVQQKD